MKKAKPLLIILLSLSLIAAMFGCMAYMRSKQMPPDAYQTFKEFSAQYDGKPIELTLKLTGGANDTAMTVWLFIDGIVQTIQPRQTMNRSWRMYSLSPLTQRKKSPFGSRLQLACGAKRCT